MVTLELKDIDIEDLEDVLIKVEDSFNFKFTDGEMADVTTFDELCEYISGKIVLDNTGGCTTQQAFYKLRSAIGKDVTPNTLLEDVLPLPGRLSAVRRIEKQLGFTLHLLRPPQYVTATLGIGLLACIGLAFFDWKTGLLGMLFCILGLFIAKKTGTELSVKTVGELAEKMTRESYLKSRRNGQTYNKKEVEKVLVDLFANQLNIPRSQLSSTATFQ